MRWREPLGGGLWFRSRGPPRRRTDRSSSGSTCAGRSRQPGNAAARAGSRCTGLGPALCFQQTPHTITVVRRHGGDSSAVLAEVPVASHDPMPAMVREGRGFLFDARLSGNGMASCASCHLDADRDGLAWDLGDPGGNMITVTGRNNSIHDPTPRPRVMHPMKGPMTTQTLRGMQGHKIFHWRGDRPSRKLQRHVPRPAGRVAPAAGGPGCSRRVPALAPPPSESKPPARPHAASYLCRR